MVVVMVALPFSCLIWQGQLYPLLEPGWILQLEIASKASNTRSADLEQALCGLVR